MAIAVDSNASVAPPEFFCGGIEGEKCVSEGGKKIQKLAKMADFDHFPLWRGGGVEGKWGAELPTGGASDSPMPPLMPPLQCLYLPASEFLPVIFPIFRT